MTFAALLLAAATTHPCMTDAAKLCVGVQPGQGRIAACLKTHESELSPECKARRATFKEKAQAARDACHDDAQRLCKDVKPGGGRVAACLEAHQSELSEECRELRAKKAGRGPRRTEGAQDGQGARRMEGAQAGPGARRMEGAQAGQGARRMEGAQAGQGAIRQACNDDIQKFCAKVRPGEGRLAACLKANQDKLQSACIDDLPQLRQ